MRSLLGHGAARPRHARMVPCGLREGATSAAARLAGIAMKPVRIERQGPVRLVELDAGPRNVLSLEAVEALQSALAA